MHDLLTQSRKEAQIRNRWIFGDTWTRIGDPFRWIDGDAQGNLYDFPPGIIPLLQWVLTYYEAYDTPNDIRHKSFGEDFDRILSIYSSVLLDLVPFAADVAGFSHSVRCNALCRAQDLAFLDKRKGSLPHNVHLDFGAGLGGPSIYSINLLECRYIAVEAQPYTYCTQKIFLPNVAIRSTSGTSHHRYVDLLDVESVIGFSKIAEYISDTSYTVMQLPSWNWTEVQDGSVGLISSSWCLNELNTAAIFWFLWNSIRTLDIGGFLYIRDSGLLKPGRHTIDYDRFLQCNGFTLEAQSPYQNRKELWGVPRLYRKTEGSYAESYTSFQNLYDSVLGRFSMTSTGEDLRQGYDPKIS